jgi:HD-like signal output (HDOD) protein
MEAALARAEAPGAARLTEAELDRMAGEIGIPPCPAILSRFSEEISRPEPDVRALAGLIGTDLALSGSLLKLVNSPFYGLRSKATNVHQALTIIGLRSAANLVSGLILRQAFPASSGPLMQRFWDRTSALTGLAAAASRRFRGPDADQAYTYALFRDCGIALMINKFPDYAPTFSKMEHAAGSEVTADEDMRYRFNHARVGYALARGWLLPDPFCQAILHHHDMERIARGHRDTEEVDARLVAFGALLDQVQRLRSGRGLSPDWSDGEAFVLKTLDLSPEDIVALVEEPGEQGEA